MAKLHGSATISLNGQYINTNVDAILTPGGGKNTGQVIGDAFYHTKNYMGSKLECKVPYTGQISLRAYQEMEGVEITFQSDTGRTFVISGAAQTGDVTLSGGTDGGQIPLVFEGEAAEEVI